MPPTRLSRDSIPDRLLAAKQQAVQSFLSQRPAAEGIRAYAASSRPAENVVGIGVGRKLVNGKLTTTDSVRLYVVRKLPLSAIAKAHVLPNSVKGVPVDVIEVGFLRAFAATGPAERRRRRPARPGCSVGFQFRGAKANYVMAGTLGAIVTDGAKRYLLSNNHVLADENGLPLGSPLFQPGLLDGGVPATDAIAKLSRFVKLNFAHPNRVDCAIAEVNAAKLVRATVLPKVGKLASSAPIAAVVGMKVHKTGRTTGYRTGVVFDVSADVRVGYEGGTATFENQVLIHGDTTLSFSDSGDSGSMIVDRATKRATALLFAGSSTHTIGNHMSDVLAALKVTLSI